MVLKKPLSSYRAIDDNIVSLEDFFILDSLRQEKGLQDFITQNQAEILYYEAFPDKLRKTKPILIFGDTEFRNASELEIFTKHLKSSLSASKNKLGYMIAGIGDYFCHNSNLSQKLIDIISDNNLEILGMALGNHDCEKTKDLFEYKALLNKYSLIEVKENLNKIVNIDLSKKKHATFNFNDYLFMGYGDKQYYRVRSFFSIYPSEDNYYLIFFQHSDRQNSISKFIDFEKPYKTDIIEEVIIHFNNNQKNLSGIISFYGHMHNGDKYPKITKQFYRTIPSFDIQLTPYKGYGTHSNTNMLHILDLENSPILKTFIFEEQKRKINTQYFKEF